MTTILIVDDSQDCIELAKLRINDFFNIKFSQIFSANSGEEALSLYESYLPDYILTDYNMSGICGEKFLDLIHTSSLKKPSECWIMSADNVESKYNFISKTELFRSFNTLPQEFSFQKRTEPREVR